MADELKSGMRRYLVALAVFLASSLAGAQHAPPITAGVAGFDVYRDGAALHLLNAEFDDARKDRALLYRQSNDGGSTWTRAVRVNDTATPVFDIVRGNDPQIASSGGRLLAVWSTRGTGYGGSGPLVTAISDDGGRTWRRGENPADDASTAGHAYVDAIGGRDGFEMVWLDGRDGAQGLRHARLAPGASRWSSNSTIQKATCECCWNTLSRSGDSVYVMYRGKGPRDMVLAERAQADAPWRRLSTVGAFGWDFKGCPHTGGGAAWSASRESALHAVVWTGAASHEGLHYLRSNDRGRTWSAPHRVGSAQSRRADLAAGDEGGVAIVWDQLENDRRAVYAMQSADAAGQRWHKPARLSADRADAVYPRVLATASGFLVAWTESVQGGPPVLRTQVLARTK